MGFGRERHGKYLVLRYGQVVYQGVSNIGNTAGRTRTSVVAWGNNTSSCVTGGREQDQPANTQEITFGCPQLSLPAWKPW